MGGAAGVWQGHNWMEETMWAVPEYADDWHPGTGHMHAIMHNDGNLIVLYFGERLC